MIALFYLLLLCVEKRLNLTYIIIVGLVESIIRIVGLLTSTRGKDTKKKINTKENPLFSLSFLLFYS